APPPAGSAADDKLALVGVWISSDEVRLIRFTNTEDRVWAYLLNGEGNDYLDFDLEESGGKRGRVGDHRRGLELRNPLYESQLGGDRLELKLLPGAASVYGEDRELRVRGNLEGTWFRVRIPKEGQ